ncbi:MAG TPA: NYN domain-containing protein, partial [Candidatus Bathyarchaeia archaeon]|nr:NYN domain-containing protein [Candidatus Bathyarchaeia archaeon]
NIFYAAKAAGVDIDYVTLLKSATAGRDLVRAYAYTGLDPDNENQRNFHDFLRRSNYKVVSKDIRKYGDGKVKANLDIELVVDMMKTARNLDIAIVVSGDGDFAPAIRAVQEMGVRCEVISFRGNTSSDLIEVADLFTDITQLARVEKGSRSGRRVADDDADLSMTEVPDKQTEGSGTSRGGRGRGRGRGRGEAEPVAARGRSRAPASTNGVGDGAGLVALPGERLSKAAGDLTDADLAAAEVFTLDAADAGSDLGSETGSENGGSTEDGPRRRRRRGGRGRGRGRSRDEISASEPRAAAAPGGVPFADEDEEDEEEIAAPRAPRPTPFGSVWDSQLGTAAPASRSLEPFSDEDLDEPEIPEYLIAEQRRGPGGSRQGGGGRGPRGGRAAYQSAMERERFGRGGGGGINRYPDVSGRGATRTGPPREDRSFGRDRGRDERPRPAPGRSSSEPWSEVPPELEALLRAQVAQKPPARSGPPPDRASADRGSADRATSDAPVTDVTEVSAADVTEAAAPKRRTTRKESPTAAAAGATAGAADATAPKRRTTRKSSASADAPVGDAAEAAAPKRRTARKTASAAESVGAAEAAGADTSDAPAPAKRRATRKPAASAPAD